MAKAPLEHEESPFQVRPVPVLNRSFELRPDFGPFGITVCRGTLTRLDEAFQGFFRRLKAGGAPGYPRFRSASRFCSLSWSDLNGSKLKEGPRRLYIKGVGDVKLNYHRPLRGIPKTLTVRKKGRHLEATVFCSEVPKKELASTGKAIGIDLGVSVLVCTSDGTFYDNPRHRRELASALGSAQRERSRHTRGSHRYRQATMNAARLKQKEANRRKNTLHKASRHLVDNYDLIVHEDLKVSNMSRSAKGTLESPGRNVAAKSGLNDAIMDSSWARLIAMITYKAILLCLSRGDFAVVGKDAGVADRPGMGHSTPRAGSYEVTLQHSVKRPRERPTDRFEASRCAAGG